MTTYSEDDAVQVADLQTAVFKLEYDFVARAGVILMPSLNCTDMSGAIAMFERVSPDANLIVTVAGAGVDTCYFKRGNGEWAAVTARGFMPEDAGTEARKAWKRVAAMAEQRGWLPEEAL